jgi:Mor family transcriptional regulator
MCSLADINIKQLSAVMDDFEDNLSTDCIAKKYNLSVREVIQIVNEMSYFRKNRHRFVSNLSDEIVS